MYVLSITAAISVGVALFSLFVRPSPEKFAVDPAGRFAPIVEISKGDPPDAKVIARVADCVTDLYNHSFTHFRTTVARAKVDCMTGGGADSFQEALNPLLETLRQQKVNMVATFRVSPNISARTIIDGKRAYIVQAAVDLGYVGQSGVQQPLLYSVQMTVMRVPWDSHISGLRVRDISLKRADGVTI